MLDQIHMLGVLHGDLHKRNILVTDDNKIVIIDFDGAYLGAPVAELSAEHKYMAQLLSLKVATQTRWILRACIIQVQQCFISALDFRACSRLEVFVWTAGAIALINIKILRRVTRRVIQLPLQMRAHARGMLQVLGRVQLLHKG